MQVSPSHPVPGLHRAKNCMSPAIRPLRRKCLQRIKKSSPLCRKTTDEHPFPAMLQFRNRRNALWPLHRRPQCKPLQHRTRDRRLQRCRNSPPQRQFKRTADMPNHCVHGHQPPPGRLIPIEHIETPPNLIQVLRPEQGLHRPPVTKYECAAPKSCAPSLHLN